MVTNQIARLLLLAARAFLWPFLILGVILLLPFAWGVDRIEAKLYGESRTVSVEGLLDEDDLAVMEMDRRA